MVFVDGAGHIDCKLCSQKYLTTEIWHFDVIKYPLSAAEFLFKVNQIYLRIILCDNIYVLRCFAP